MIEFIITQTYRSKEDRDAYLSLAKAFHIEELSQQEHGNLRYEYLLPTDGDEKKVILLEMWETPEDQKVHTGSEHFSAARNNGTGSKKCQKEQLGPGPNVPPIPGKGQLWLQSR